MYHRAYTIVNDYLLDHPTNKGPLAHIRWDGDLRLAEKVNYPGLAAEFGSLHSASAALQLWAGSLTYTSSTVAFNTNAVWLLAQVKPNWKPWRRCLFNDWGRTCYSNAEIREVAATLTFLEIDGLEFCERFSRTHHYLFLLFEVFGHNTLVRYLMMLSLLTEQELNTLVHNLKISDGFPPKIFVHVQSTAEFKLKKCGRFLLKLLRSHTHVVEFNNALPTEYKLLREAVEQLPVKSFFEEYLKDGNLCLCILYHDDLFFVTDLIIKSKAKAKLTETIESFRQDDTPAVVYPDSDVDDTFYTSTTFENSHRSSSTMTQTLSNLRSKYLPYINVIPTNAKDRRRARVSASQEEEDVVPIRRSKRTKTSNQRASSSQD